MTRACGLGILGAVVLALGGCATPPPPPVAIDTGVPALTGTIMSVRPVMQRVAGAEDGVLGALGAPAGAGDSVAPATEFIVRETSGRIISVIQPAPSPLRRGEAVRILRGDITRLAPLAPGDRT